MNNGLDNKAFKDFSDFMTDTVIPGILLLADKHNYERDSFIRYTADTLSAMAEVATFENYKLPDAEGSDKE